MGHPLCNFLRKKNWPGQVRSRSYNVIRRTTSCDSIFHRNRVFSNVTCCHWLEWRNYVWFRLEYDHIWPLTLHLDLSEVIWGHWPWPTPYLPIVAKLVVLGFLEVLRVNTWFILNIGPFLRPLYSLSCQPGTFAKFALGLFSRWGWRRFLLGCYTS